MKKDNIILRQSIKTQLWTEQHPLEHGYRVTMSGSVLSKKDYINIDIMIDRHVITMITHKNYKRGYLHYFHYESDDVFESNGCSIRYDLYLPVDDVLDNKEFFTTNNIERRILKINKLVKLLKNKIKKVQKNLAV
jgi:hypothetical protein